MKKIFSLLVLALFLVPSAEAIRLGSVVKEEYKNITLGEMAEFTALVWNPSDESYSVRIYSDDSEGLNISIEPKEFLLNSSAGSEYLIVGDKSIMATAVRIIAKPKYKGNYSITVRVVAGTPDGDISFFQERLLRFRLSVAEPDEYKIKNVNPYDTEIYNQMPNVFLQQPNQPEYLLYILAVICVLLLSLLIYKYA